MTTFSQAVANVKSAEIVRTENGMKAFATSDSKVLDLFGVIGSARGKDITRGFQAALAEDSELAVRTLLWARDVRGGAGERQTFRNLLRALETVNPALAGRIMSKVPFLGRWDDLFAYTEQRNRSDALHMYADALRAGDKLAAKWAPREMSRAKANTAGKQWNNVQAKALRAVLGMDAKAYRKLLAANTEVVETAMCAKDWDSINFSHVPSLAAARYQKAFGKRAGTKYADYLRELQKPEAERAPGVKINAGAVFPYDVVKSIRSGNTVAADAQWDALPNYIGDSKILPMVDVSDSMTWFTLAGGLVPRDVAMSLGLYMAHHTSSDFKDMLLTFDSRPQIFTLRGSLAQKLAQIQGARIGGSTDLHAAFESVLTIARNNHVAPENMPNYIAIFSDMEFNTCARFDDRAVEMIRRKYSDFGYKMPGIIFWNLKANAGQTPVKTTDKGVVLVSGFSPAIMASVLGADPEEFTPYAMMMKTLNSPRYDF